MVKLSMNEGPIHPSFSGRGRSDDVQTATINRGHLIVADGQMFDEVRGCDQ